MNVRKTNRNLDTINVEVHSGRKRYTTVWDFENMSTCLDENCEDDDDNSGCDEKFLAANVFWKGENQGKGNCSSQATVGQTKLVF